MGRNNWYVPDLSMVQRDGLDSWDHYKTTIGPIGADHLANNLQPAMCDRSFAQMRRCGMTYAAVPLPTWEAFCRWSQWSGSRTDWATVCAVTVDSSDEDIYVCLLDKDHDGDCGFMRVLRNMG